jgi:hypothetical protein
VVPFGIFALHVKRSVWLQGPWRTLALADPPTPLEVVLKHSWSPSDVNLLPALPAMAPMRISVGLGALLLALLVLNVNDFIGLSQRMKRKWEPLPIRQ